MLVGAVMRRLLIVLFSLLAVSARAGWQAVDESALGKTYADPATIVRNGDGGQMWWLLDYASFQRMVEVGYFSQKSHSEFDCGQRRARTLETSLRAEHMGEGKAVYSDDSPHDWEPVDTGSVTEKLWKLVCGQ
jgi:hypothetical protein